MAERSSASTDVKILLQSLVTVAIIVVGGYFGMTFLGPQLAELQPESVVQPTLPAYEASEEADTTTDTAESDEVTEGDGGDVGDSQSGSGQPSVEDAATLASGAGRLAEGGQGTRPGPGARQTAIALGTPMPEGSRPGGRLPGAMAGNEGGPDARLTAIAQGTMLPREQITGADGQTDLRARMTAIAQGTFMPGQQTAEEDAAATHEPATAEPSVTGSTGETDNANESPGSAESDGSGSSQDEVAPQVEATPRPTVPSQDEMASTTSGPAPTLGGRLFAVTRGAGAKLYDRPDGEIVSDLIAGSALTALARSDDGLWTLVQGNDNAGWIPLDQLVLFGAENLPVLSDFESAEGQLATNRPEPTSLPSQDTDSTTAPAPSTPVITPAAGGVAPVLGEYIEPVLATVISQFNRLNVRSGPGTTFDILDRADPGEEFVALARTALGDWVQVALPDTEEGAGWVSVSFVDLSDRVDALPVSDLTGAGTPPAGLPTPTPIIGEPSASGATPQTSGQENVVADVVGTSGTADEPGLDATDAVLELRDGPGAEFDLEAVVDAGLDFIELARSDDGAWARIAILEPPGGVGWVDVKQLSDGIEDVTSAIHDVDTAAAEPIEATESPDGATASDTVPFQEPVSAIAAVRDALLNVRSGPGTEFGIIEKLDPGAIRSALSQSPAGEWTQIAVPDAENGTGWVATEFVELSGLVNAPVDTSTGVEGEISPVEKPVAVSPTDALMSILATVTTEQASVNAFAGPGTEYDVVEQIAPGEEYLATARSVLSDWVQIALTESGNKGWVASDFVELNAPVSMLDVAGPDHNVVSNSVTHDAAADVVDEVEEDALSPPEFLPVVGSPPTTDAAANLGGTLVFEASNGGQIFGHSLDTGSLWPITMGFDPAISPDGHTVAFTRDGGENGLYLVDIDGGNERLIFSGGQRLASPKWSPAGNRIVFSRGDDAYECVQLGRGGCTPIDELGGRSLPDDVRPITWINYHLSVVDTDGGNYHDLGTLESARAPDWNEAGIVYQSAAGLQRTSDEANATSQVIVNDVLKPYFHDPDWQPAGNMIVYQGKEASHWEIFRTNVDGSELTALTRPKTALVDELPSNVAPAWSPDGNAVVFLSNRTESGEAGEWRIWVMNADGGNQRPLTIYIPISYTFGDEQVVSWGPSVN